MFTYKNFSIFGKILTVSLILLALTGIVAITSYLGTLALNERDDARLLEISLLDARSLEKDFLASKNPVKAYSVKYKTHQCDSLLNTFYGEPVIDSIRTGLSKYTLKFDSLFTVIKTLGFNEDMGAEGSLRRSIHSVEDIVKNTERIDLLADMLMARRSEKDYFLRGKPKYINRVELAVDSLKRHALNSEMDPSIVAEILKLADAYYTEFSGTSSLLESRKILKSQLETYADYTLLQVATLVKEKEEAAVAFQTYLAFVIAFAIILGIILSIFLASSFVKPIRKLENAATKIAGGDVDIEIDSKRTDEIGALEKSFVKMIKTIKKRAEIFELLAQGDLNVIIKPQSEKDIQAKSMEKMVSTLKNLINEIEYLTASASQGDLKVRGHIEKFEGVYKHVISGINDTLDAVVQPLKVTADYIKNISEGTIPEKITTQYEGEFNELKKSINRLVDSTNQVAECAVAIAEGNFDVSVIERSSNDKLMKSFNTLVKVLQNLEKELSRLTYAAREGKLDERGNEEHFEGEYKRIVHSLNDMMDEMLVPVHESNRVLGLISKGNLSEKVFIEAKGDHQKMIDAVNDVHGWFSELIVYVTEIANGNLEATIEKKSSDDQVYQWFVLLKENIKKLTDDTNVLVQAAVKGDLSTRADVSKHKGEYGKIVEGINNTLDAVIAPLHVTADYVARISKGDIPEKISQKYQGDFEELRNNMNILIEAMNNITTSARAIAEGNLNVSLQERSENDHLMKAFNLLTGVLRELRNELTRLTATAKDGKLQERANSDLFSGAFQDVVTGLNEMLDATLLPVNEANRVLAMLSQGDLSDKITIDAKGDHQKMINAVNSVHSWLEELIEYITNIAEGNMTAEMEKASDNDQIHEWLVLLKTNVRNLVDDVNMLSEAAIEGKLSVRAEANRHKGEFRKIVEGVNKTLDSVVNPLSTAATYIERISKGDLPEQIRDEFKGDFNNLKNNLNVLIDAMEEITNTADKLAQGDFTVQVKLRSENDMLMLALNNMVDKVGDTLTKVRTVAEKVATGSKQMTTSAEAMSSGATEQAASLEEISSSMNEVSSQTQMTADFSGEAKRISAEAREVTEAGNKEMQNLLEAMEEINIASHNISGIIKVIDEIAFQTNLLALNAAVEAARAGRHGKGFAVVAEEVRNLAARSAKAASETTELIENAMNKSENGSEIVKNTAEILKKINQGSSKTAELLEEIDVASKEQASSISSINSGLSQIEQVTQQNTAFAMESASEAQDLSQLALDLETMLDSFNLSNERLLVKGKYDQYETPQNEFSMIDQAETVEVDDD